MKFIIEREPAYINADGNTVVMGRVYCDRLYICNSMEIDHGKGFVPAGLYNAQVSFSYRHNYHLPQLLDVLGNDDVRIGTPTDGLSVIGVGQVRSANGLAHCFNSVNRIIALMEEDEARGRITTVEII